MSKVFVLFAFLLGWQYSFAQPIIGGVINDYTKVTAFLPCANAVTVNTTTGFDVGDTVLIIQMQGATINTTNTSSYGAVTGMNEAGNYEVAIIGDVTGMDISFTKDLLNAYDPAGSVQLVSIPQYASEVEIGGTMVAQPWDGNTGGVLALQSLTTITMRNFSTVDISGLGFRGGSSLSAEPNSCNFFTTNSDYSYTETNWRGSYKGEGVHIIAAGTEYGRGAPANAGGGGNDHNAGGGGGGAFSTGGIGGRNNEPGTFNCKGHAPGEPGKSLTYSTNKVFMGGGGGAGHGGNNTSGVTANTAGGAGGGIAFFFADTFDGNNRIIRANGAGAGTADFDGAGGGGAGGTIVFEVNNFVNNVSLEVLGGNGGHARNGSSNRCYGPGGGGSGGAVYYPGGSTPAGWATSLNGGAAGFTFNSTNGCNLTNNSAAAGGPGAEFTGFTVNRGTVDPAPGCLLPVELVSFQGNQVNDAVKLQWTTSSEINNDYFVLERTRDFSDWSLVENVSSQNGSSTSTQTYVTYDRRPYPGRTFYRLRQIDLNGAEHHGGTIEVTFDSEANPVTNIYPNPVKRGQNLTTDVFLKESKVVSLSLFDATGKLLWNTKEEYPAGAHQVNIPTHDFPKGIYFLKAQTGSFTASGRVIVRE